MAKKIEGLEWEDGNVDEQVMPEYPKKRLRATITTGSKTEYYWYTYIGLLYLAGKTLNGKDMLEHVFEKRPEHICAMPYKTGSKEYMEACKLYKIVKSEKGDLYIPGFQHVQADGNIAQGPM